MSAQTPRLGVAHPTVVPGNHPGTRGAEDAADDEAPDDARDVESSP